MHTSRSPESAPSTLACAASSTELSGTARSFANWRDTSMSSSGMLISCSPRPGTGLRVHRGMIVNPLISHLPRRVSSPPRVCRDILSLHEEGFSGHIDVVTHSYVVMHEGADADRTS